MPLVSTKWENILEIQQDQKNYIKKRKLKPKLLMDLSLNTESPSVLCCIDLEKPEEESKWTFVSDSKIGLLPHHDSLLKSKESQIRAHKEELNQRLSNLTLTDFFMHLEKAKFLLLYLIFL